MRTAIKTVLNRRDAVPVAMVSRVITVARPKILSSGSTTSELCRGGRKPLSAQQSHAIPRAVIRGDFKPRSNASNLQPLIALAYCSSATTGRLAAWCLGKLYGDHHTLLENCWR